MVIVVILFNLILAIACLYVAWRIGQLRSALAKAADAMISAERATHRVLAGAPRGILRGQTGIYQLRQQYQHLELRLQRVQKILSLLGLTKVVWQWYGRSAATTRRLHQLTAGRVAIANSAQSIAMPVKQRRKMPMRS